MKNANKIYGLWTYRNNSYNKSQPEFHPDLASRQAT